jgi:hypothetical protein
MSPEEAFERIAFYCDHPGIHSLIAKTVSKLPDEVAVYACCQCIYLSIGDETFNGVVLPGRIAHPTTVDIAQMIAEAPRGSDISALTDYVDQVESRLQRWIVLLNESIVGSEDAESIVAHEIAHAWLRHDRLGLDVSSDSEREAEELTGEWGFSGLGADVEHCTSPFRKDLK